MVRAIFLVSAVLLGACAVQSEADEPLVQTAERLTRTATNVDWRIVATATPAGPNGASFGLGPRIATAPSAEGGLLIYFPEGAPVKTYVFNGQTLSLATDDGGGPVHAGGSIAYDAASGSTWYFDQNVTTIPYRDGSSATYYTELLSRWRNGDWERKLFQVYRNPPALDDKIYWDVARQKLMRVNRAGQIIASFREATGSQGTFAPEPGGIAAAWPAMPPAPNLSSAGYQNGQIYIPNSIFYDVQHQRWLGALISYDGAQLSLAEPTVSTVTIANQPPTLQSPARPIVAYATEEMREPVVARDADLDALRISLIGAPAGMQLQGGMLRWAPTLADVGVHSFNIRVSDGEATVDTPIRVDVQALSYPSLPATASGQYVAQVSGPSFLNGFQRNAHGTITCTLAGQNPGVVRATCRVNSQICASTASPYGIVNCSGVAGISYAVTGVVSPNLQFSEQAREIMSCTNPRQGQPSCPDWSGRVGFKLEANGHFCAGHSYEQRFAGRSPTVSGTNCR